MSGTCSPGSSLTDVVRGPKGWSVEKLAMLVNVVYGKSPAEIEKLDDGIPIFGTGGVVGYTSEALCDGPSVILGRKGTIDKVQRSAGPFWAIDTTYYTTPKGQFDWSWLYYAISSFDLRKLNEASGVPSLSRSSLEALDVASPPLPEQQKIAAILTAVDDKLDVIARQIDATQALKQGLMQTLFSRGVGTQTADGRWVPHAEFKESELGGIPAEWTLMPLEELAVENITYGVVQPGESVEGGIPLVRGGDIKGGRIAANLRTVSTEISSQFKRTILKGGELLVSLVGYPGETAVVPSQLAGANIARQAGMIRTGSVSTSEFIHYYLSSPVGKSFLLAGMIGSAQQVINLKALREVLIPLPSVAERERICSICSAVTKKLQVLEDKQSSFQDLKRGLMQKLLTGEWRVSVDASATGT